MAAAASKRRCSGLHHVDLSVSDLERSGAFYDAVLGLLGCKRVKLPGAEEPAGFDWRLSSGRGPWCTFGLYRAKDPRKKNDRRGPGLHHLAFHADSRKTVNAVHRLLAGMKARILWPPAEYREYGKGYYAVFFLDPDGVKLEVVHDPSTDR